MTVVLDASVILKWLLRDLACEPGTEKATALVQAVVRGEVAAVLARLTPTTAIDDAAMLTALEFPTLNEPLVMIRATTLAIDTGTHLFDTLYHAVALAHAEATLVTADGAVARKPTSSAA